jgi:hypothetical protein
VTGPVANRLWATAAIGNKLSDTGLGMRVFREAQNARAPTGIVVNEHTNEDGATVFRHACKLGFEGIVSKRLRYVELPEGTFVSLRTLTWPAAFHRYS